MTLSSTVGVAAAKLGDRGRQEARERTAEGGDAQAPGAQPAERVELCLGGGDVLEDRLGMLDQQAAGIGERDRSHGAVEQRELHLVLECRDLLRDRSRATMEARSCTAVSATTASAVWPAAIGCTATRATTSSRAIPTRHPRPT
jgi:hypothetical protein